MLNDNLPNKQQQSSCPVIGFVAYSGTGKTTLLKKIIASLKKKGLRIGVIKHAHHDFDIDIPGKDSYELRKSGAEQMLVASRLRWALVNENHQTREDEIDLELDTLLAKLNTTELDLVLVEGFKHSPFPKIELHRPALAKPLLYPEDNNIIAIASDVPLSETTNIKSLDLNHPTEITNFILKYFKLKSLQ